MGNRTSAPVACAQRINGSMNMVDMVNLKRRFCIFVSRKEGKPMTRRYLKRCIPLERRGVTILNRWLKAEGRPKRTWRLRVFLSSRRRGRSGCAWSCSRGTLCWRKYRVVCVHGIIVLPLDPSQRTDELFKHELLHVLLDGHGHDSLFQSWKRTVGAL